MEKNRKKISLEHIKKNKNFYIAMTLCIGAVTAAGWSTYQSVKNFLSPVGVTSKGRVNENRKSERLHPEEDKDYILDTNNEESGEKFGRGGNTGTAKEETQLVSAEVETKLRIYPTTKNIIKEYSGENPVYSKTFSDWRTHEGTDFKAEEGSLVKAITDGKVKSVNNDSNYGTVVEIEHVGGFTAYYCGLGETAMVREGQEVRTGDDIGCIKNVPSEILDEPHLHLMVRKDEKFIDPMLILDNKEE